MNLSDGYSQNIDCSIRFTDRDNLDVLFYYIVMDDSVYIQADLQSIINDNEIPYKFTASEGKHRIYASMEDYRLIDTIVTISVTNHNFTLPVDMKNDFHLYEFNKTKFDKIYTKNYETIIGLKNDGTFLKRSFFHQSLVGCFQFERGKYSIDNEQLILDVTDYNSKCFKYSGIMNHRYEYTIKNDSIMDIGKYDGFIVKKYMGVNP